VIVEITEVSLAELDGERLEGCVIESPRTGGDAAGNESDAYAFVIEGWALGREQPVKAVEVLHDGKLLWQLPTEIPRADVAERHPGIAHAQESGFYGPIGTLTVPPQFEFELRALLADGSHARIGVIRGRRAPLRSSFEAQVQPLMITTLGRTGCHLLMRTLSNHPRIASYRPYQYETKIATYWTEVLRSLSEPASYLRQLSHARNLNDRRWWLGTLGEDQAIEKQTRRTVPRPLPDPEIQHWMGTDSVETLAGFCQSRIEGLYREIGRHFGKPDLSYFVEKYHPSQRVPPLMWELFPNAREIILVRDFRDMVSSQFAFDAKRGFDGFGRRRSTTDSEHVERLAQRGVSGLLASWRERGDRAHLLRYEDLILSPRESVDGLLSYLDLERDDAAANGMIEALSERSDRNEWHRTTDDPKASIGRWQRDLSPELQRVCEQALGPILEQFGYAPRPYVGA
jgi:hypothetical protein